MAPINPQFPYSIFKFIHKPIRIADRDVDNFLERFLNGEQAVWENMAQRIQDIQTLNNPETIRADLLQYLKDIVGLTRDLRNITDSLSEADLRKVILLAIPLWKSKGLEVGFKNIIKLFTGFNARVFNWFDYRMIIGEKAIGEEQLGEDAWLISRPGVVGTVPAGESLLLLQFENHNIKDGSLYQNNVIPYGDYELHPGGAFSSSKYFLKGTNHFLHVPHRSIWDFKENFTFEINLRTWSSQVIPLFYKWDNALNKGIKLHLDTATGSITCVVSDGTITHTSTALTGLNHLDDTFRHIAWAVDWKEGLNGETSVWVGGQRVINATLSGSFVKDAINHSQDLFIGAEEVGIVGSKFGIDSIRISKEARYDVNLASITASGVNYVEYQEEQLDEFQIDIRVVDDGSLDRTMLKRILNLMRGSSERLNVLFIDFYDDFESGKGQYQTIAGSAYTEFVDGRYLLKLPENSLEHADVLGSSDWTNYLVQQRCVIYSGQAVEFRFLIQDDLNYYAFRVNSSTKLAYFEKAVAGVRTSLASPQVIDIETATPPIYIPYYVFMMSSFKNENTGIVTLKCYIDSCQIFSVDDPTYYKGTFGLYVPAGSTVWCSEAEMFQLPLEYDRINPNSEF